VDLKEFAVGFDVLVSNGTIKGSWIDTLRIRWAFEGAYSRHFRDETICTEGRGQQGVESVGQKDTQEHTKGGAVMTDAEVGQLSMDISTAHDRMHSRSTSLMRPCSASSSHSSSLHSLACFSFWH
jgi:hypothetical protein